MILDSGNIRQLGEGIRDMGKGKGRCDLVPLEEIVKVINTEIGGSPLEEMAAYQKDNNVDHLAKALLGFCKLMKWDIPTMTLEVAKHYEEGLEKYPQDNWKKLPAWCMQDSATRHLLKWTRNDQDESHSRAFVWNLLGLMYIRRNENNGKVENEKAAEEKETIA